MAEWIAKETAAGYTKEALLKALNSCYSYENHAAHGVEDLSLEYCGAVYSSDFPDHLYLIYLDKGGTYWYKTVVETPRGRVELYEYVFGHKETERRRRGR